MYRQVQVQHVLLYSKAKGKRPTTAASGTMVGAAINAAALPVGEAVLVAAAPVDRSESRSASPVLVARAPAPVVEAAVVVIIVPAAEVAEAEVGL